jgi:hypothetical protein
MIEIPENVDLHWLARPLVEFRQETRAEIAAMRRDLDMTIRLVTRVDHTLNALREDVRDLWLGQGELRRRIEALEERPGR